MNSDTFADPALDTLLLPVATGDLAWPATGRILFMGARMGPALTAAATAAVRERLVCRQTYRPFAEGLAQAGFAVEGAEAEAPGPFPLILALPPRQRDAARGMLAEAVSAARPGGIVAAALANNEGARAVADDFAALAGAPIASRSKNKARVFWVALDPARIDGARRAAWAAMAAPRWIEAAAFPGGGFWSRPGLFAWDRVDAGSALLARHLPPDLAGHGGDLGCGQGYLAAEILARAPGVNSLDLYDAERQALDLARRNLEPRAGGRPLAFHWQDVARGLGRPYDFIVSNPPFHVSRAARADLGQAFIATAARALRPGGRFLLVANRHLPYERILGSAFGQRRLLADEGGYKVIEAVKS